MGERGKCEGGERGVNAREWERGVNAREWERGVNAREGDQLWTDYASTLLLASCICYS